MELSFQFSECVQPTNSTYASVHRCQCMCGRAEQRRCPSLMNRSCLRDPRAPCALTHSRPWRKNVRVGKSVGLPRHAAGSSRRR